MKSTAFILFLSSFLLIISCAIDSVRHPSDISINNSNLSSTDNIDAAAKTPRIQRPKKRSNEEIWQEEYQQALSSINSYPKDSCSIFSELSKKKDFPLKKIAWLRAFSICSQEDNNPPSNLFDIEQLRKEPWLKSFVLEMEIQQSISSKNTKKTFLLYEKQYSLAKSTSTKIEILEKALALAKQTGDTSSISIYEDSLQDLDPLYFIDIYPNRDIKLKDSLRLAYEYRKKRKFSKARSLYQKVFKDKRTSIKNKIKALKGIRTSYKLERKTDNYLTASATLHQYVRKLFLSNKRAYAKTYHDISLLHARAIWTDGRTSAAVKIILQTKKDINNLHTLTTVHWLLSRIAEERRDYKTAIKWIDLADKSCRSRCVLKDKISWYKAWFLRKNLQFKDAVNFLKKLIADEENDYYNRYLFWLAQNHISLKEYLSANTHLQTLSKADPMGYYGLLAQRELSQTISLDIPIFSANTTTSKFYNSKDGTFSSWLIAVEEVDLASRFLNSISRKFLKQKNRDETLWTEIFSFYAKTNDYQSLYITLNRMGPKLKKSLTKNLPQLLFPQPFRKEVNLSSQRFDVPSELIYAIMRQESAFNYKARSHADAFGLMQLLPSVAKRIARRSQIHFSKAEDLFIPQTNIHLGSALLRQLSHKYQNQFILFTASYNASEKALMGWVKHRFHGDPLEFIEEVPYQETRGYIKLVLRNFLIYKIINSPEKKLPFPEWCLKGLQRFKS